MAVSRSIYLVMASISAATAAAAVNIDWSIWKSVEIEVISSAKSAARRTTAWHALKLLKMHLYNSLSARNLHL